MRRSDQVAQDMIEAFRRGAYAIGDALPPEAELCRRFKVSRATVRTALSQLQGLGLVHRHQGAATRVMATEWAARGVRVNALAPGPFATDMMAGAEKSAPGFNAGAAAATLQKRVADPDEIIGSVLYLASDASSFTTGSDLIVAGGMR